MISIAELKNELVLVQAHKNSLPAQLNQLGFRAWRYCTRSRTSAICSILTPAISLAGLYYTRRGTLFSIANGLQGLNIQQQMLELFNKGLNLAVEGLTVAKNGLRLSAVTDALDVAANPIKLAIAYYTLSIFAYFQKS